MTISTVNLPWPLDRRLRHLLEEKLTEAGIATETGGILSFRDPDFTPESGGFHPVEIAVGPGGQIEYVTDFAYMGRPPFCELVKEIDFDFSLGILQHFGVRFPIRRGRDLFRLWEENFIAYHAQGAYSVTIEPMG